MELHPKIFELGKKVLIKTSPLYDVSQAFRLFPSVQKVSVISLNNECKEVWIEIIPKNYLPWDHAHKCILETICIRGTDNDITHHYSFSYPLSRVQFHMAFEDQNYLFEGDVAFYKARCFAHLIKTHFSQIPGNLNSEDGFFFTSNPLPIHSPGKRYQIVRIFPYKPRKLKKWFSNAGVQRANLVQKNFPFSIANIRKQLQIREGGSDYLIFTLINDEKRVILAHLLIQ